MAIDELQQIAQARATMLLRGFEPLWLDIGRDLARQIEARHPGLVNADLSASVFDMPFTIRDDMEGFAVRPA